MSAALPMQAVHACSGDLLHFYTGDGICSVFCQFVSKIRGSTVAIVQVDMTFFKFMQAEMPECSMTPCMDFVPWTPQFPPVRVLFVN